MALSRYRSRTGSRFAGMLLAVALVAAVSTPVTSPLRAQVLDVQAIVAVVNDQVISRFDVEQRVLIVTNGAQVPEQVLRQLRGSALETIIDERLQIQEAIKINPTALDDVDIDDAMNRMYQRNNMSAEQFTMFINQLGVEREAFETRALAEALWSRLISGRMGPQAAISESEVLAVQSRLERSIGNPETHLMEIFVPVDFPEDEQAAFDTIRQAHRALQEGQAFDVLARSVSQGTTASEGGDIDWLQAGALAPEIEVVVAEVAIGEFSEPVRGEAGYYIFFVRNRQTFGAIQALGDKLSLRAIMWDFDAAVPSDRKAILQRRAEQVSSEISECSDVFDITEQSPLATAAYFGDVREQELPSALRDTILSLEPSGASQPVSYEGTLYVFSLCSRDAPAPLMPSDDEIQDQIFQQKLNMLARRYLRDLRAQAIIDVR